MITQTPLQDCQRCKEKQVVNYSKSFNYKFLIAIISTEVINSDRIKNCG